MELDIVSTVQVYTDWTGLQNNEASLEGKGGGVGQSPPRMQEWHRTHNSGYQTNLVSTPADMGSKNPYKHEWKFKNIFLSICNISVLIPLVPDNLVWLACLSSLQVLTFSAQHSLNNEVCSCWSKYCSAWFKSEDKFQFGPKLNTKVAFNTTHPPPPPPKTFQ